MQSFVGVQHSQLPQSMNFVPDLSIVIVCRNNRSYLEPCLESLHESCSNSRLEVVVVDNGSTDGTQAMLGDKFPAVQIIQNHSNVGLSKGSNQGILATQGRYVLLLNDDTLVNMPSLDAMMSFLEDHPDAGGVGGQLMNSDGTVQSCYSRFPTLCEEFLVATRLGEFFRKGYPGVVDDDQVKPVGWIGSACLMLRRSALDQVGLLDEDYFIYGDEADLQYRLMRSGWKVYYLPHARTIHYGGRSMNRWARRKMVYRGKMLFYRKNYGLTRTTILRIMLGGLSLTKVLLWAVVFLAPKARTRAQKELRSNLDVLGLCWKLA